MNDVGAIVLCGGKSRRMGRPKAWLPFGPGEVMLQRVVRLLRDAVGHVIVVAAAHQELPDLPGDVRQVFDFACDRGPLQGLAAGMSALPDGLEFAYVAATDVPFLSPPWIRRLRDRIGTNDIAMPFIGGYHHPLAALYRSRVVLPEIERLLSEDQLRPVFLVNAVRSILLGEGDLGDVDPDFRTLRNLNTPEDYEKALADR